MGEEHEEPVVLMESVSRQTLSTRVRGAIALLVLILISACGSTTPSTSDAATDAAANAAATPAVSEPHDAAAEASSDLAQRIGQRVTVRNDIETWVGAIAFVLDDDQILGGQPPLVIHASGQPFDVPRQNDIEVQVSGTVERFVRADIAQRYGLDLPQEDYGAYEGQLAILAESVVLSPDPGDLTQQPDAYYGKRLAIAGEVEDVIAPNVFQLDEEQLFGAEDLLVIVINPEIPDVTTEEETEVTVTGILRPFQLAEFQRDYSLDWDRSLQRKIEAEYANKPVLVGQEVYVHAAN